MSTQVFSEDPNQTETEPREYVRRRKTTYDYILGGGSIAGAVAAITVLMGSVTDALPFVQKRPYALDWAANDVRMQVVEGENRANAKALKDALDAAELSLLIQLQGKVDALGATLRGMPENNPNRADVKAAYDELNQRLRLLNAKLGLSR